MLLSQELIDGEFPECSIAALIHTSQRLTSSQCSVVCHNRMARSAGPGQHPQSAQHLQRPAQRCDWQHAWLHDA